MKQLALLFAGLMLLIGAVSAEPLKIGLITDLSGGMAAFGRQSRLGAQMAAAEINRESKQLELVFADHQLQPKVAISEAHKMVSVDKVDGVFCEFSGPSAAIAPIARENGVLLLYSAVATSVLKLNPDTFKVFLDYQFACKTVVEIWKTSGITQIAVLKPNAEYGELCSAGARMADPNLTELSFDPGSDVDPLVMNLARQKVEAILNVSYEADQLRMFKSLGKYRFLPILAMEGDDITDATRRAFPEITAKTLFFGFRESPASFKKAMVEFDPSSADYRATAAATTRLHILQMFNALKKCGQKNTPCITQAMAESQPDPATGFLGFKDRIAQFDIAFTEGRAH